MCDEGTDERNNRPPRGSSPGEVMAEWDTSTVSWFSPSVDDSFYNSCWVKNSSQYVEKCANITIVLMC